MKKVRFESPAKSFNNSIMNEKECHSPRPFIERQIPALGPRYNCPVPILYSSDPLPVHYSSDPVRMLECSGGSPYPLVNKTQLPSDERPKWSPSNDLDLSMLDGSHHEPRKPMYNKSILKAFEHNSNGHVGKKYQPVLSSIENKNPPNVLRKDDFFLKRDNLNKYNLDLNPMQMHFNRLSLDKENNPIAKKLEIMTAHTLPNDGTKIVATESVSNLMQNDCRHYHCVSNTSSPPMPHRNHGNQMPYHKPDYNVNTTPIHSHCHCLAPVQPVCACCDKSVPHNHPQKCSSQYTSPMQTAVDKKTWAIEKYEQNKKSDCMEVEKQTSVVKDKREPTVSDLFKIIKLQNEQLQLLQEKVDKFMSVQNQKQSIHNGSPAPIQSMDHVAIETVDGEHKISIGVMTSFEMVRTSTIINKEVLKTNENAIQCNRSQISIKEVVSKSQPQNLNFLDGIVPVERRVSDDAKNGNGGTKSQCEGNEEKTFNEYSLYNVQVDNATTPLMSPDQSLYLDVRDYSDSEAGSDDQSNIGWTYYNKVMTHVNGMLQDSDMPSSASALYRNTRQQMQTVQMQIDKTNVSVTKRVKFGDDPLGIHQPHIYAPTTDTSLKMNQLAAKYLQNVPPVAAAPRPPLTPVTAGIDMSFATRNYMERHKLMQGISSSSSSPPCMPRFLDITALKQQPKLL